MGVIYKLKDEVVQFIISQRQTNPLFSCRQLAESASHKFGLHLSKSSVNDVLKESGIVTPRGRKPQGKFQIPAEKKKQIQASLSQVKLNTMPASSSFEGEAKQLLPLKGEEAPEQKMMSASPEYEGAGRIFLKAALWDLGILNEGNIKDTDWAYYLTYSKGVQVNLENKSSFFIDLPVPIERCIREIADGLINNVQTFIVTKVSDEAIFRACMEAKSGLKIDNICIVDSNDHILLKISDIMECKRSFLLENRIFVENYENDLAKRSIAIFFLDSLANINIFDMILSLKGTDSTVPGKYVVTLLVDEDYKNILQKAADRLNSMLLRNEDGKLLEVKIKLIL